MSAPGSPCKSRCEKCGGDLSGVEFCPDGNCPHAEPPNDAEKMVRLASPCDARDLMSHDVVASDQDYVGWYPCESHTRGKAMQRFLRSMRRAGWGIQFTDIRATVRNLRLHPQFHEDEGRYVECHPDEPGATPVWRCELRGYGSYVTQGRLGDG